MEIIKDGIVGKDHLDITNVINLASRYVDDGLYDQHMELWSDDEFAFEGSFGTITDKNEYFNWLKEFSLQRKKEGGTRHLTVTPILNINGNEADFTSYLLVLNQSSGSFMGLSVMTDKLKRTTHGWKFTHRKVEAGTNLSDYQ